MRALSNRNVGVTSHKNEDAHRKILDCREICENTGNSSRFPLKKLEIFCYFIFLKYPNISSMYIGKSSKIAKTEKLR